MVPKAKIFLVDDNPDLRETVCEYLSLNDYQVEAFEAAEGVLEEFIRSRPDLVILDVMLPQGDGFSLAKELRNHSRVPLIFLTARESESDRITGFELGADDYVVKPFSLKELVLRVNALLRRVSSTGEQKDPAVSWKLGNEILQVAVDSHRLYLMDREISLTPREWRFLLFLMERPQVVARRDEVLSRLLDSGEEASARTVDTYVKNIRAKLGNSSWVETVRGYGYRFNARRTREQDY